MRIYEASDGAELHADLANVDRQLRVYATFADGAVHHVEVAVADLEDVVRDLYLAAGKEPPLILPQPPAGDLLAAGPHGNDMVTVTPSPARWAGNLPGVMLRIMDDQSSHAQQIRLIGDEPMRVAAALVSAMREAEIEPDEAEVETLARLMQDTDQKHPLGADFNELARAILRARYTREASAS